MEEGLIREKWMRERENKNQRKVLLGMVQMSLH